MPLLRIETQSQSEGPGSARQRRSREQAPRQPGRRLLQAAGLGALAGLVVVAGLAFGLLSRRSLSPEVTSQPSSVAGDTASPDEAVTAAVSQAAGVPAETYEPQDIIAWIRGEPYSYGQLLQAVRVARVLAYFTGDAVPSDTSPEMPGYQVQMLRRQIDLILLKQAMSRDRVAMPPLDGPTLVEAFLNDAGLERSQLEVQLAANGVTQANLEAWFVDAAAVNAYIQQKVAPGKVGTEREAAIRDWLDAEWDSQEIVVRFYDPDQVLPRATGTTPGIGP